VYLAIVEELSGAILHTRAQHFSAAPEEVCTERQPSPSFARRNDPTDELHLPGLEPLTVEQNSQGSSRQ
jgi:hypothetical protein